MGDFNNKKEPRNLLIIGDDPDHAEILRDILADDNTNVAIATCGQLQIFLSVTPITKL